MTEENVLIIPKPGVSADGADPKDCIFHSKHNSLKVAAVGHSDISVPEYTGFEIDASVDIPHGLGYAPFYLCFFKLKHASKLWMQDSLDQSMLMGNFIAGHAKSNDTNLHAWVTVSGNNLAAFTAVVYYQILIDVAYES